MPATSDGHKAPYGADKPKCGGARRQSTGTCERPAGWGTPHPGAGRCKLHGGCIPTVVTSEARKAVEREARAAFGRLADVSTPVADPLTALADLAGHVGAWMQFLADRVADLQTLAYSGEAGEQVKGEIVLFERALDRCNTVLGTYARLNIDERLARISEQQADMVLKALGAGLDAAGVTSDRRPIALRAAAGHLRLVKSG